MIRCRLSSSAGEFGRIVVARLRRATDRYPHDGRLAALPAELRCSPGPRGRPGGRPDHGRSRILLGEGAARAGGDGLGSARSRSVGRCLSAGPAGSSRSARRCC
ncbi:hypothetical protein SGPA1_21708 [Streptomyces misionensis JCM 4497]